MEFGGGLSVDETLMEAGGTGVSIPAGVGRGRAREGAEELQGEARRVGARCIEAGRSWRGAGASSVRLAQSELEEGEDGERIGLLRADKSGARGARGSPVRDAWSRRRRVVVWAAYRKEQGSTVPILETF